MIRKQKRILDYNNNRPNKNNTKNTINILCNDDEHNNNDNDDDDDNYDEQSDKNNNNNNSTKDLRRISSGTNKKVQPARRIPIHINNYYPKYYIDFCSTKICFNFFFFKKNNNNNSNKIKNNDNINYYNYLRQQQQQQQQQQQRKPQFSSLFSTRRRILLLLLVVFVWIIYINPIIQLLGFNSLLKFNKHTNIRNHTQQQQHDLLYNTIQLFPSRESIQNATQYIQNLYNTNNTTTSTQQTQQTQQPKSITVSIILMNHKRSSMLLQSTLIYTLLVHPSITTIIICHSNYNTMFNNTHLFELYTYYDSIQQQQQSNKATTFLNSTNRNISTADAYKNIQTLLQLKIQHINAIDTNQQYGLALRFYYCSTIKKNIYNNNNINDNDWIIHIDDDIEISSYTIDLLIRDMIQNPYRIVGYYGRSYNYYKHYISLFFYNIPYGGYDTKNSFSTTTDSTSSNQQENEIIVLTKILIVQRIICTKFIQYESIVQDIIIQSQPKWNGEDLFLNLIANQYYKVKRMNTTSTRYGNSTDYKSSRLGQVSTQEHFYTNYINTNLSVWEADTILLQWNSEFVQSFQQYYNTISNIQSKQQYSQSLTSSSSLSSSLFELIQIQQQEQEQVQQVQQLHPDISGNLNNNRCWDVTFIQCYNAIQKARQHTLYRGKLWQISRQRLSLLTTI